MVTIIAVVLAVTLWKHQKPENVENYEPVSACRLRFLSLNTDGLFEPAHGLPVVKEALSKSLLEQAFDGVYNKYNMRCRLQVLSGALNEDRLQDYRILLVTSQAKRLVSLRVLNGVLVSSDFVGVKDSGIPSVPGIEEIKAADDDRIKATLVVRKVDASSPLR